MNIHKEKKGLKGAFRSFKRRIYQACCSFDERYVPKSRAEQASPDLYKVIVKRPGMGVHSLLIEKVTRTENAYHVTFYDPYDNKIVTLPYKELEKVLTGHYTLPSKEQMKTREPILKRLHTPT